MKPGLSPTAVVVIDGRARGYLGSPQAAVVLQTLFVRHQLNLGGGKPWSY